MNNKENKDMLDLGSTPIDDGFDPFADDIDVETTVTEQETTEQGSDKTAQSSKTSKTKDVKQEQDESAKPPVFEYAGATENIDDTSKTFDELRIEKAIDFPELEDSKRVSWTVDYGKISKAVVDPKGTSIGKMKTEIETSKQFIDSLKKSKDKNPVCKVKPRITAQSKGILSAYKGVFTNLEDAEAASKVISIVPAKDGKVYEIRNTKMGKFITPIDGCELLSDIKAGFVPALPRIPMDIMMRIVALFRYYMYKGCGQEVLVNVYWDEEGREFIVDVPKQTVSKVSVESSVNPMFEGDRYIHYMDIHSHNNMKAFFSATDDADERATRLYTVIGRLDKYFPDVVTRISNGGKFVKIDPAEVFERIVRNFPDEWTDNICLRDSLQEGKPYGRSDSI